MLSCPQKVSSASQLGTDLMFKVAIRCLQRRYDRQRLIHQAYVRTIYETPSLRDGNGSDLRRLHMMRPLHI